MWQRSCNVRACPRSWNQRKERPAPDSTWKRPRVLPTQTWLHQIETKSSDPLSAATGCAAIDSVGATDCRCLCNNKDDSIATVSRLSSLYPAISGSSSPYPDTNRVILLLSDTIPIILLFIQHYPGYPLLIVSRESAQPLNSWLKVFVNCIYPCISF